MRTIRTAALASLAAAALAGAAAAQFIDGIAAQVGSDIVLASEVERFAMPMQAQMREAGAPEEEIARMRAEILERMIERRLLDQAIRRTEIEASEAEVDTGVEAIAKDNGISVEKLRATVEAGGLSYDEYREQIRSEIRRQKLMSAVVQSKVRVEEPEVLALYEKRYADQPRSGEEVRLSHILVPFPEDSAAAEAKACEKAAAARKRVAAGEDFAKVAAEVTVVNPERGGDVGWLHTSNLAPWMVEPLASLQPGQMSQTFSTRFGCNVLLLAERRPYQPITFEEARASLHKELFERHVEEEYAAFLETLREQTYVERKGVFADAVPSLTSTPAPSD